MLVAAGVEADSTVEAAVADTRASFSTRIRVSAQSRSARGQAPFGRRRKISGPTAQGAGQRPGTANTPNWDNRLNAGNRANIENRANAGNGAYVANRPINGNNGADFNPATGTMAIGTAIGTMAGIIIGRWAGGLAGIGRAPPFRRFPGPGDIIHTTTLTTADRTSPAAPSITRSRSWRPQWPSRRPAFQRV